MNTAEKKIYSALKVATSFCNKGDSPTEALIKAANKENLNPEMTKRVCESLNIALTQSHLKTAAARGLAKTDDFPLADFQQALESVFVSKPNTKTASARPEPHGFGGMSFGRHSANQKVAAAPVETPVSYNIEGLVKQAEGFRKSAQDQIKQASLNLQEKATSAFDCFKGLVSHFSYSHQLAKYAAFEEQCYSEYGLAASCALDAIHENLPASAERAERVVKKAFHFVPGEANRLFDRLIETTNSAEQAERDLSELTCDFQTKLASIDQTYRAVSGLEPKAGAGLLDFSTPQANKRASDGTFSMPLPDYAGSAVSSMENAMSRHIDRGIESESEARYKRPVEEADNEMENVRRMAILRDLMANDEIISAQDPSRINSAYNTLLSISPSVTTDREVVRAVLRNATAQQAIDPFSAKQLADLEGQKLKNKAIASGKPVPAQAN